jgi:hypothetical protein
MGDAVYSKAHNGVDVIVSNITTSNLDSVISNINKMDKKDKENMKCSLVSADITSYRGHSFDHYICQDGLKVIVMDKEMINATRFCIDYGCVFRDWFRSKNARRRCCEDSDESAISIIVPSIADSSEFQLSGSYIAFRFTCCLGKWISQDAYCVLRSLCLAYRDIEHQNQTKKKPKLDLAYLDAYEKTVRERANVEQLEKERNEIRAKLEQLTYDMKYKFMFILFKLAIPKNGYHYYYILADRKKKVDTLIRYNKDDKIIMNIDVQDRSFPAVVKKEAGEYVKYACSLIQPINMSENDMIDFINICRGHSMSDDISNP